MGFSGRTFVILWLIDRERYIGRVSLEGFCLLASLTQVLCYLLIFMWVHSVLSWRQIVEFGKHGSVEVTASSNTRMRGDRNKDIHRAHPNVGQMGVGFALFLLLDLPLSQHAVSITIVQIESVGFEVVQPATTHHRDRLIAGVIEPDMQRHFLPCDKIPGCDRQPNLELLP